MNTPKECPKCKIKWEEEQTIYEHYLDKYNDEIKAENVLFILDAHQIPLNILG